MKKLLLLTIVAGFTLASQGVEARSSASRYKVNKCRKLINLSALNSTQYGCRKLCVLPLSVKCAKDCKFSKTKNYTQMKKMKRCETK